MQELLQNAEDAGATVVKFLYDTNSYGQDPSKLSTPRLAKYQVCHQAQCSRVFRFQKTRLFAFFEMACQKVVKSSYSKSFVLSPSK